MMQDDEQTRQLSTSDLSASEFCRQIDARDVAMLISFFKLLDSWDRERECNAKVM
jgi:hypothetical protein